MSLFSRSSVWSAPVKNGLHIVTVRIAQEHTVVARVVFGPQPGRVQHLDSARDSGIVNLVYGRPVWGLKSQVQLPSL
jgi:hypothetical protein